MEINFTTLRDAQELQQLLQSRFIIGKATVKDIQEFLRQQNLQCSDEIKQGDKYFNALLKTHSHQSAFRFDSYMGCKISVKSSMRFTWNLVALIQSLLHSYLVEWHYLVRFYFDNGILTEIITQKVGTGF